MTAPDLPRETGPAASEKGAAGPVASTEANLPVLRAAGLRVAIEGRTILGPVDLQLRRGEVLALVGPNGSGKSTLLRALSGTTRPADGDVFLDDVPVSRLGRRALARRVALLPQSVTAPEGLTVSELVAHGRHPHRGFLSGFGPDHREIVAWAIAATGLGALADRSVETLSGGERQRAFLAMALAQKTDVMLLDEPTTYLDIRHQIEILNLIRRLNRDVGVAVVWVLHDLDQAAAFSDRIAMLRAGRLAATGAPHEVITRERVREVFQIDVTVGRHPQTGRPVCLPSFSE